MIPIPGADPEVNVLVIGARILAFLHLEPRSMSDMLVHFPSILNVSMDHVILSLDWLNMISAIQSDGEMISIL
jgi:hypothetical protein